MLSAQQIDQAARHLLAARSSFTAGPCMPDQYRPADTDDALAIQKRVLELRGETVGGWKCGVPKGGAGPIVASIPASAILRSSPCAVPGDHGLIEPEIAMVLGRDLAPRATPYNDTEIRSAIGECRMVVEFLTTSYADKASATPAEILADAYNNHGLLIGPVIPRALDQPLERLHVLIQTAGAVLFDKDYAHPSGHPLKAFAWLVHFLTCRDEGLKAGQVVTTGSYAGVVQAPLRMPIHVSLDGLGALDVELVTAGP